MRAQDLSEISIQVLPIRVLAVPENEVFPNAHLLKSEARICFKKALLIQEIKVHALQGRIPTRKDSEVIWLASACSSPMVNDLFDLLSGPISPIGANVVLDRGSL